MSNLLIILPFWLLKFISCPWNHGHEFLLTYIVYLKGCIKISKLSIWEPLIDQIHDVISLINTKTKMIFINPENSYMGTDPSWILISDFSSDTFLSSVNMSHCLWYLVHHQWRLWGGIPPPRKHLDIDCMIYFYFLIFHNFNHHI